jgi:hypothetical protein
MTHGSGSCANTSGMAVDVDYILFINPVPVA